jgi:hypothetical protein
LEERVGQLDEGLSLASDLWRLKRIVGDARVSETHGAGGCVLEVGVASSGEDCDLGRGVALARVWSRGNNDRVERDWRRWRDQVRTVHHGRRRASEDGGLAEHSGTLGEDSHRHFRNRE